MAIGPDALSIRLRERKLPRAGADGDNDVLRLNIRYLTVLGDTELAFARQLAVAKIDSDLVLLHQARDALVQLLCNTARTLNDLIKLEGGLFPKIGRESCRERGGQ